MNAVEIEEAISELASAPKLAKLKVDRQFRMEWEFNQAAASAGLAVTPCPIDENAWCYV